MMPLTKRLFLLICISIFAAGCSRNALVCRSEYLYPDYLASEQILAPDAFRRCFYGQQLVVHWNLPAECEPTELSLKVRYGSREEKTFSWSIHGHRGYRIYRLINDDYWCLNGIVSYKASLYENNQLLKEWTHMLWVDTISLSNEP